KHETRHLQRQRHQCASACPAALVGTSAAGCDLPARAESTAGEISRDGASASRLSGHLSRPKELERCGHLGPWTAAGGNARGLPGDPDDLHSRFIETMI